MSTQSYYKDRLGFDPREALYDGPVKSPRGHSQNSHYNGNNDHYATPPKKHKQQHHHASYQQQHEQSQQQGGYEDALTQFKGSMSLWEYFVENGDKLGMSVDGVVRKREYKRCMVELLSSRRTSIVWPTCRTKRKLQRGTSGHINDGSPETLHRGLEKFS